MESAISDTKLDRRLATPSPLFLSLAVLGVASIAFATLCPISMRPHLATANVERFGAYFVLGVLVALAARRRWLGATAIVVVVAFVLEGGQLLVAGRDPAVSDAIVKALGGVVGSAAGQFIFPLKRLTARMAGLMGRRAGPIPVGVPSR